jgi:hypothetical protein
MTEAEALALIVAAAREHASELDAKARNPHAHVARGQSSNVVAAWAQRQAEDAHAIRQAIVVLEMSA